MTNGHGLEVFKIGIFPQILKWHSLTHQLSKGTYGAKRNRNRLTLNDEGYPFADGGRDFVAGNAEVRPHLLPRYVLQKSHICDMSCKNLIYAKK